MKTTRTLLSLLLSLFAASVAFAQANQPQETYPVSPDSQEQPGVPHQRENMFQTWGTLSPRFKRYLITSAIFSLAYFSFSFLLHA